MKRNLLTVAIIAASAMGFSACSNSYKTAEQATTPTSPVVAESKNKDDRQASWSYVGNTGPEYWGDVEGATTCGIGQEQSPIDIKTVTASVKDAPTINYSQSASLNINDNGHTMRLLHWQLPS
nr:carbonic anhydrase family protein [Psychrobacter fulvigenes]